jgi:4'-phosphopantetheinyl transferase
MGSATARRRYVSGRVAVRHALGERLGLAPVDVPLEGADGRIHLVDRPDCHVALSHAADLVAVAVSTHGPIGIDVEAVGRSSQRMPAAALSPPKVAVAAAHIGDRLAPLGVWVAQEAALKADGIGLAFPLSEVTFDLCAGGLLVRLGERSAWGVTLRVVADAVVAVAACGQPPLLHRRMWTEVERTLVPTGLKPDA